MTLRNPFAGFADHRFFSVAAAILVFFGCASRLDSEEQQAARSAKNAQSNNLGIQQGRQVFESSCAACHGLDGRGGERGPDIATKQKVQARSDAELVHIVENGVLGTGMPSFESLGSIRIKSLILYVRTLQGRAASAQLPGNPEKGKALFFGKAECSECHMARGAGGFIGSDLSVYARARSVEELRRAIAMPNANQGARGETVVVTTRDGQKYSGIARNEDNFSLQLQTLDGTFHLFLKSELEHLERQPESLMPSDYGSKLSQRELDDLVSFLLSTANAREAQSARRRKSGERPADR
jgi:cytochrome c oxidase cbb3-type subunit 3